jgi:hypothetical protein
MWSEAGLEGESVDRACLAFLTPGNDATPCQRRSAARILRPPATTRRHPANVAAPTCSTPARLMMWNGGLGALNNCAGAALTVARSRSLAVPAGGDASGRERAPIVWQQGPKDAASLCRHAPRSFPAFLRALTTCLLRAKSGQFEKSAQVRGFSPPQGEDRPHLSQRIGARPAMQ